MKNKSRESNIELLKIFAVFLIILCHTSISMTFESANMNAEWYYDVNALPNSIGKIVLTLFSYCGYIGNSIFFVCSAWFLLEKKQNKKIKILKMELDVWIISVIYLAIFLFSRTHLNGSTVIRSLFPTTFNNNWFVTAYMLFYFIFPALNGIIENTSRVHLRNGCLFFAFLICIWVPFFQEWSEFKFYFSYPMMWVLVYFCVAYLKTYHRGLLDRPMFGFTILMIGIVGLIGEIAATYYFGSYSFIIRGSGMRWYMWYNPFIWLIGFGSFNLFRTFQFHSQLINRVSTLSLLVYLIHENPLLKDYWRPYIYIYIHNVFHNEHILWLLLFFAFLTFIISFVLAFLYQISIQRFSNLVAEKLFSLLNSILLRKNE